MNFAGEGSGNEYSFSSSVSQASLHWPLQRTRLVPAFEPCVCCQYISLWEPRKHCEVRITSSHLAGAI